MFFPLVIAVVSAMVLSGTVLAQDAGTGPSAARPSAVKYQARPKADNAATGQNSSALGHKNTASGAWSNAFGYGNRAQGTNSNAFGNSSVAQADESNAFGTAARALASQSLALGTDAQADVKSGVALGYRSRSDRAAGVAGYDPLTGEISADHSAVWLSTVGVASIGDTRSGITRQLTGVAAGTEDTDAVNVASFAPWQG